MLNKTEVRFMQSGGPFTNQQAKDTYAKDLKRIKHSMKKQ